MPQFDGTGPAGRGAKTGRGLGPCGGGTKQGMGRRGRYGLGRGGFVVQKEPASAKKSKAKTGKNKN